MRLLLLFVALLAFSGEAHADSTRKERLDRLRLDLESEVATLQALAEHGLPTGENMARLTRKKACFERLMRRHLVRIQAEYEAVSRRLERKMRKLA